MEARLTLVRRGELRPSSGLIWRRVRPDRHLLPEQARRDTLTAFRRYCVSALLIAGVTMDRSRYALVSLLVIGCFLAPLAGQQSQDPPTFRTGTELVTVDAIVVDKDGRHVTDIRPEEFKVTLDGKRQTLRQAVYVPTRPAASAAATPANAPGPATAAATEPAPASRLGASPHTTTRENVGRVLAVVVDDLGLSFESTYYVRRALTKLVDEQIQPSDLVAVLRSSSGVGALQQFTRDKRLLHAAIDRIRWTIISRSGIGAFAPIGGVDAAGAQQLGGSGTAEFGDDETLEGLRTNYSTAGSLAAIEYVIRGVQDVPGRKSVLFVTDGLSIFHRPAGHGERSGDRTWNQFTRLMDTANRAGVIVYTIDARGLQTARMTAEDSPEPVTPRDPFGPQRAATLAEPAAPSPEMAHAVRAAEGRRSTYLRDSQESLHYMAEQTGGFAIVNNNDMNLGFSRVLNDLAGYYLLGFERPAGDTREWDPGKLKVEVMRDGVRVRSRKGLFGPADPRRPPHAPPGDSLVTAALSPFEGGAIDVRLTALFGHDATQGSYMRSLFFIDPAGVSFAKNDAGVNEATLTLLLLTVGEDGATTGQWRRPVTLRLTDEQLAAMRQRGLLYNARIPMKAIGGYQVRAAVRDERTGQLGSASQFFEIPRVGKGRVTMSGVVLQGVAATETTSAVVSAASDSDAALDETVLFEPGVRIFNPGADAVYSAEIYDGLGKDTDRTLVTSTALLRDGRVVFESSPTPLSRKASQGSVRVVPVAGRVTLSPRTPPGLYTLRVTVAEQRGGKPRRASSQWVDFEVRP
jgi:VWFA-related protein